MDLRGLFKNTDNAEKFPAGSAIFEEGSPGDKMYIVLEGEVDINAGNIFAETVTPGNFFGEMALIDSHARSASATAKTDCLLAPVNEKRFLFLVQQTPFFSLQVMRVLATRIRRMNNIRSANT